MPAQIMEVIVTRQGNLGRGDHRRVEFQTGERHNQSTAVESPGYLKKYLCPGPMRLLLN